MTTNEAKDQIRIAHLTKLMNHRFSSEDQAEFEQLLKLLPEYTDMIGLAGYAFLKRAMSDDCEAMTVGGNELHDILIDAADAMRVATDRMQRLDDDCEAAAPAGLNNRSRS